MSPDSGRLRAVLIDAEWQYEVLIRAARLSNPRTGSMIPDSWSLKQWYRHFYHVLQKHGITRSAAGVTVHGLRHAYLQNIYEKITGVPAPIKRPDRRPDPQLHQAAMQRLVEAAGHSLAAKATAYISTFATMDRLARPVVSSEQAFAAVLETGGNKSDAAKGLGISRQALYRLLAKCERVPVAPKSEEEDADSGAANAFKYTAVAAFAPSGLRHQLVPRPHSLASDDERAGGGRFADTNSARTEQLCNTPVFAKKSVFHFGNNELDTYAVSRKWM